MVGHWHQLDVDGGFGTQFNARKTLIILPSFCFHQRKKPEQRNCSSGFLRSCLFFRREHRVHLLDALVLHRLSGVEITLARYFHSAMPKAALDLLDVDAGFA